MALTADQRAMLQLLLERGQSYDDIASLLGTERDDVRARARAALTELGGSDPDAEVGLTDYLLGQADPIGRADAVRQLQNDPESHELASRLSAQLQLLAPEAQLPQLPKPKSGRASRREVKRPPPTTPSGTPAAATAGAGAGGAGAIAGRVRTTLSERQRQVFIVLGALAVLLIVGLLVLTGAFGGDDESSSEPAASSPEGEEIVTVPLEAQGGSEASGEAVFGIATADTPYVDVNISGLEAPPEGETYVIWLLLTPEQGYPLSPLPISEDGTFSDRFPIPQFAIPIASRAQFVDVSLSENAALQPVLEKAVRKGTPILDFEGERVLSGEIPATGGPAVQEGGGAPDEGAAPQGGGGGGGGAGGGSGS
jgi:hypothetical protein